MRYVTDEASAEARRDEGDTVTTRVTIGPYFGCDALEQRVLRFAPGLSRRHGGSGREELLFAVAGSGTIAVDGAEPGLAPDTGILVPPRATY